VIVGRAVSVPFSDPSRSDEVLRTIYPFFLSILASTVLLAACGRKDVKAPGSGDRTLYLTALEERRNEPSKRFAICDEITDEVLRGDCGLAVATELGKTHREAQESWCERVSQGYWRSECWFTAAEQARRHNDLAKAASLCEKAAEFHDDCGQHLWQTAVREIIHNPGPEGFVDALPEAERVYAEWKPLLSEGTDFEDRFWRRFYQNGFEPRAYLDLSACDPLDAVASPSGVPQRTRCREAAFDLYSRRLILGLQPPGMLEAFCKDATDQASTLALVGGVAKLDAVEDPGFEDVISRTRKERCR
jgi:hypothetical protein